ncbi:glycosyltransferase family 4 protein [Skermania piniformis]|uniref:Glycosyltransferase family 4 protein n=1 Tax=Skermania pinensis TaxID=39122 RepID=A0ABX8SE27_9ACTN|nr:glycosyltransferase family 4 protein [Skermania piniformis]
MARTEIDGMPDLAGLRVGVVAGHYAPETTGSAPYNVALVEALTAAGVEVELITGVPHYPQWTVREPRYRRGVRWRETDGAVRITRVRHAVPARPDLRGRARQELSFAALAAPHVAASRADVLIAVTPLLSAPVAAFAGRRGRPLAMIVHDLTGNAAHQSGTTGGRAGQAVAAVEYRMTRRADLVGVITRRFRDVLVGEGGVDPARIVDLRLFSHIAGTDRSRAQARAELGWPDTGYLVVHTGNQGMKQGLEAVVEAARIVDRQQLDVTFVMVGDGNQRSALEGAGRGLRSLRFVDPVDAERYPLVLAAADVLLVHERPGLMESSLPSKLTSYTTVARPILAAVEPGGITHDALDEFGAALCVPPGSPEALVAGVRRLRAEPSLAQHAVAGAAALRRARFDAAAGHAEFRTLARRLAAVGTPIYQPGYAEQIRQDLGQQHGAGGGEDHTGRAEPVRGQAAADHSEQTHRQHAPGLPAQLGWGGEQHPGREVYALREQ